MNLAIIPHNDDESLFLAFTLLREQPLVVVVTDSWIQLNRGETNTADSRWQETVEAMKILGCPCLRLGIRDDIINEQMIQDKLSRFIGFDKIYIPAIQGGNIHHDMIGRVSENIFPGAYRYATYTKTDLWTTGSEEIVPSSLEIEKKNRALECYKSQLYINKPHFDAVKGRSEWFI